VQAISSTRSLLRLRRRSLLEEQGLDVSEQDIVVEKSGAVDVSDRVVGVDEKYLGDVANHTE
jgi:hypothetical protein